MMIAITRAASVAGAFLFLACAPADGPPEAPDETPAATDPVEDPAGPVDPNLASADALAAIPGLTPEIATSLVEGRPWLSPVDLRSTLGASLDEDAVERALQHVFVPIDLNSASREELLTIPGVGERMAHEFEEYRPYDAMARFRREIGKYVDEDEVERLSRFVFIPVELNSATDEQILAIPGVGERMLHEFLEYRPYESMEQFRREIGKYVDENELARLERYVTLGG